MAVFKRGSVYWYEFVFSGVRIRESTKQGNKQTARQMEAAKKTGLAKGLVDLTQKTPPKFKDFAEDFRKHVKAQLGESTADFYEEKLAKLLAYKPFTDARIDRIDKEMIANYADLRLTTISRLGRPMSIGSVNRELATLRKLLLLAREWGYLPRPPKITLLPGEREREFVLSQTDEPRYLSAAPQQLQDLAVLMLDTGLRLSEALTLQWPQIIKGPRGRLAKVLRGKSRYAKRALRLTPRTVTMLRRRRRVYPDSAWIFPGRGPQGHLTKWYIDNMHRKVRTNLKMPKEFVVHSLRHTFGTRLGESGADAFTIQRIMGHHSVTVSQKYVHPSNETQDRAIERMDRMNRVAREGAGQGAPTNSPTAPAK